MIRSKAALFSMATLVASFIPVYAQAVVRPGEPIVKERGPHEQRWEHISFVQGEDGAQEPVTNSYVELATGLNRWDGAQWVPASPEIEIVDGKGVSQKAQHKAIFSGNANSNEGLLDVETPDGERLTIQPVGIALTEAHTGKSVFIGEIQNSAGELLDSTTIIYPNAFDGIEASILIKNRRSGIESDVILESRISPEIIRSYGLDPEQSNLEVWHQVLRKPNANKKISSLRRGNGREDENHEVQFGQMAISLGNAFHLGDQGKPAEGIGVAKNWITIEGIDFLVESIPFKEVEGELLKLPEPARAQAVPRDVIERALALQERGVRNKPVSLSSLDSKPSGSGDKQMAFLTRATDTEVPEGFLIDYPLHLSNQTNYTLRADTTYWITDAVHLYGTTTLEGGAVVKFTNYYGYLTPALYIRGDFKCETAPYNPAIFTAEDDDSVGERISTSTGVPLTSTYYAAYNLRFNWQSTNTIEVHDIHTRYAHVGLLFERPVSDTVWNVQVYNCYRGIEVWYDGLTVRNALLNRTRYTFNIGTSSPVGENIRAEHLTVNSAERLFLTNPTNNNSLWLTNSLLCNITNSPTTGVYSNSAEYVSATAFTNVGGGHHYLPEGSPYRDAGTDLISSQMKAILRKTSTHAPMIKTTDFTMNTVVSPVVERDTVHPDLGYHYMPLDYLWSGLNVTNATLVLTNGVAVGHYGYHGTFLRNGGNLYSSGKPGSLNTITRYETVQERSAGTSWSPVDPASLTMVYVAAPLTDPEVHFNFSRMSFLAQSYANRRFIRGFLDAELCNLSIRNSELYNTYHYHSLTVDPSGKSIVIFNNLFLRGGIVYTRPTGSQYHLFSGVFGNNTLVKGASTFHNQDSNSAWTIKNNLFDRATQWGTTGLMDASHNAYLSAGPGLGGSGNVNLSSVDFVEGPFGKYYFPKSGTGLYTLIDKGSTTADALGLYHFTTGSEKETNSVVDIGFHYPAVSKVRFVGTDTETMGDWKGVYGHEGFNVFGDVQTYPSYATVTPTGKTDFTWASSTTDGRALERASSGRIAACWYSGSSFDIALTQSDHLPHTLALYCLDWDGLNRAQDIQIKDSVTGQVYDSRTVSTFTGGQYFIWEILGDADVMITSKTAANAVLSGLFFGDAIGVPADTDGDGIADLEEDANGNGIVDSGESNYSMSNNGLSGVADLEVFTPLN